MKKILPAGCFLLLAWLAGALFPETSFLAGHGPMPAISEAQADKFTTQELMAHGRGVLMAGFHSRDEAGKVNRRKERVTPHHFKRIPAPNANACISCHYLPYAGGGGEAPGGNS